jgi:hypothetical protein
MTLVDAVARIQQIQGQLIAPLQNGGAVAPPVAAQATAPVASASGASFANVFAQAQAPTGVQPLGAVGLPARAAGMMTPGQRQFATQLAAQTGLDPQVVAAWMLAEESGGAAA